MQRPGDSQKPVGMRWEGDQVKAYPASPTTTTTWPSERQVRQRPHSSLFQAYSIGSECAGALEPSEQSPS